MTSSPAVPKKIKIKDLPKIKLDVYSMIALNNLVVYAVHYLQEHGVTVTVEEVVSVCFRLFPQSFALKNYPRWPDSALVIRRLNDGREKGNIKGNSMDGFALKYRGQQLAKRVAKALGLAQPAPVKVKKRTAPLRKENVPVQPVKVQSKRTRVVSQKKKVSAPVIRKKTLEKQLSKPATVKAKQETLPLIKMEEKPRKKAVKSPATVPVKKTPIKKKPQKQSVGKTAKQLTLALPTLQEKKAGPVVQASKKKRKISATQPEKNVQADKVITPAAASHVSNEEKAKAGKFVHSMERSDAYIHYKKNGKNSKIGEFDFRSLLLCTMESSRETLVKNVKLFKGYASIHNRQDLLVFLSYCEDKFSYLLSLPQKQLNKPIRRPTR